MRRLGMSDAAVLLDAGPEDVAKTLRSLGYAADADRVLRAEAKRRRKAATRAPVDVLAALVAETERLGLYDSDTIPTDSEGPE